MWIWKVDLKDVELYNMVIDILVIKSNTDSNMFLMSF